jgi:hypothetical protein
MSRILIGGKGMNGEKMGMNNDKQMIEQMFLAGNTEILATNRCKLICIPGCSDNGF